MYFRKTTNKDLLSVLSIYKKAISYMREHKNTEQWNDFEALRNNVISDILKGISHVLIDEDEIKSVFTLMDGEEPSYSSIDGKWIDESPYLTIHRLAVAEHEKGYASLCFAYGMLQGNHIRIDTHGMNHPMRRLIQKMGFMECGVITLSDGTKRIAYEKKVSFSDRLISWYELNGRDLPWRKDHDFYHVYLSETMLQQTRVESVKKYYQTFVSTLPTLKDLAKADEDVYLKLWQGLGYYSRVKNLAKGAKYIVSEYGDSHPETKEELLQVPGIGAYTANAILSICLDKPYVAVDGNLLRVFSRLTCHEKDIGSASSRKECEEYFLRLMDGKPSQFNQALMDLGELVCSPHGEIHCDACPLNQYCLSFRKGVAYQYPRKKAPGKKKEIGLTVFLIRYQDSYLIRKRGKSGLLSSLYEFFNVDGHMSEEDALRYLSSQGFVVSGITGLPDSRHVFTHLIWNMKGYEVVLDQMPSGHDSVMATKKEIMEVYSIPSAFHLFLKKIQEE